jgi:hypothetical protein
LAEDCSAETTSDQVAGPSIASTAACAAVSAATAAGILVVHLWVSVGSAPTCIARSTFGRTAIRISFSGVIQDRIGCRDVQIPGGAGNTLTFASLGIESGNTALVVSSRVITR